MAGPASALRSSDRLCPTARADPSATRRVPLMRDGAGDIGTTRRAASAAAASGFGLDPRRQLFLDAGRLAAAAAQVVQLGAAHVAAALDLDAGDQRAVGLERALHTLATGDLAHGERAVQAAVALGDHHAFIGLQALAVALDHVDADDHGVAGREGGNGLAQTGNLFLLQGCNQVHVVLVRSWPRCVLGLPTAVKTPPRRGLVCDAEPASRCRDGRPEDRKACDYNKV